MDTSNEIKLQEEYIKKVKKIIKELYFYELD